MPPSVMMSKLSAQPGGDFEAGATGLGGLQEHDKLYLVISNHPLNGR